jgi:hypothetical protein
MTIIPRALVSHQLRCDVQDCHACGGDHVGMLFRLLTKPYGAWTRWGLCPATGPLAPDADRNLILPVLMTESQAGPFANGKDD